MNELAYKVYTSCSEASDRTNCLGTLNMLKVDINGYLQKLKPSFSRHSLALSIAPDEISLCFEHIYDVLNTVVGKQFDASYFKLHQDLEPDFQKLYKLSVELLNPNTDVSVGYEKIQNLEYSSFSDTEKLVLQFFEPYAALQTEETWLTAYKESTQLWFSKCSNEAKIAFRLEVFRLIQLTFFLSRCLLVKRFSYSVPSTKVLEWIKLCNYDAILELGCGKGYWSHLIKQSGTKVFAQDVKDSLDNADTDGSPSFLEDVYVGELTKALTDKLIRETCSLSKNTTKASHAQQNTSERDCFAGKVAILICWAPKFASVCKDFISVLQSFFRVCETNKLQGELILVGDQRLCGSHAFWETVHANFSMISCVSLPRFVGHFDSVKLFAPKTC